MMGSTDSISFPDEYPPHEITVTTFLMDRYEVTNSQFLEFVNSTGYVTTAERIFKYFEEFNSIENDKYALFEDYFSKFYNFCFELPSDSMIREAVKFNYGSS